MSYFIDKNLNIITFQELNNSLYKGEHVEFLGCLYSKKDAELFIKAKKYEKETKNKGNNK